MIYTPKPHFLLSYIIVYMTTYYNTESQYIPPKPSAPYIPDTTIGYEHLGFNNALTANTSGSNILLEQTNMPPIYTPPPIQSSYQTPTQSSASSIYYSYGPHVTHPPYVTNNPYQYPYYYDSNTNPICTTKISDDNCHQKKHCHHDDHICWCTII
ncbi:putative ORFan [Tupanvirus deep ocean]|uniref:ORFan n=2 Tax=Tupanvirus TaxID=2094720 RepID=A0AC62A997_9VIRU|nr:putative ORFan [Tupanvirus deep ocean]QKU34299.1 putative ORFan [Tupanvirus deep ocean]